MIRKSSISNKPSNWKYFILLGWFAGFSPIVLQAQNADNAYRKPISETLRRIEDIFQVKTNDPQGLLEGKELDYADWRIKPGDLEVSLTHILAPFDLTFFEESARVYTIRKFEYPRRSVAFGSQHLNYLTNLYTDLSSWEGRKSQLRSCMREALDLNSLEEKAILVPIRTKIRNYKGYSVENVALEILPGVFTTGSVYRPHPVKGKYPVIISPNGHFGQGRYREDQQLRSAMLAKMGAIVVSYDLFAWGESLLQFASEDHRTGIAARMQAFQGMRWLDYLLSLPEADPEKVGITGGSGGGSQTLFLTAMDDRIKVSVPVVMVSSHFSGGCPCESGVPIHLCGGGTNNAEIAALAAPRPQLIISDGKDWTHSVPTLEYPFIQRVYGFYNNEEQVVNIHFPDEGHDYGLSKRLAMYPFMAKHLGLDLDKIQAKSGEIKESGVEFEKEEQLLVFGVNGSKLPGHAIKGIAQLYRLLEPKE